MDVSSELLKVLCGMPEDSILGIVLFVRNINGSLVLGTNLENISKVISGELDKINVWFSINKLLLNVKNTNYLLFGNKEILAV